MTVLHIGNDAVCCGFSPCDLKLRPGCALRLDIMRLETSPDSGILLPIADIVDIPLVYFSPVPIPLLGNTYTGRVPQTWLDSQPIDTNLDGSADGVLSDVIDRIEVTLYLYCDGAGTEDGAPAAQVILSTYYVDSLGGGPYPGSPNGCGSLGVLTTTNNIHHPNPIPPGGYFTSLVWYYPTSAGPPGCAMFADLRFEQSRLFCAGGTGSGTGTGVP